VFGFVTKAQLERRHEELRREYQAALEDQRAIVKRVQVEWEEWFDKFRRLLMRLNKRVADAQPEGGTPGKGDGEIVDPRAAEKPAPVIESTNWSRRRSMRGF
jgi:hypothetical protein